MKSTYARLFISFAAALWAMPVLAGEIFVTQDYGGPGVVGEYATSGATVNASLVTGLDNPGGIAVSGSDVYVLGADSSGPIGEYTTSGATVSASLVAGPPYPQGIAVSGGNLFVSNAYGTIGEYNATTGETIECLARHGTE